jgi:hypothetical protein
MCHNSYAHVMLQYSIKFEFKHLLQLFGPIVSVQANLVRLVDAFCLGEYSMLIPVTCTLSGLIESTVMLAYLNSRCYLVLSCNVVALCTALDVTVVCCT